MTSVQIVVLEPMRVAGVRAEGRSPERDALAKLLAWARPRGLLADAEAHPVFGFNDPSPSSDSSTYGYRFWIRIPEDFTVTGGAQLEAFDGGRYAVARCHPGHDLETTIPAAWKALAELVEASGHTRGTHQWLERHLEPDSPSGAPALDLYYPIA